MNKTPTLTALNKKVEESQKETQEALENVNKKIDESFAAIMAKLNAKDRPVEIRKEIEPQDAFEYTTEITDDNVVITENIGDIGNPLNKSKLDRMQFDNDILTIVVHDNDSEDVVKNMFPVSVNGKGYIFKQGEEYKVPRNIVEVLLRSKKTTYGSNEYVDRNDGIKKVNYPTRTNLRYPISILHDPRPKEGAEWAERIRQGKT